MEKTAQAGGKVTLVLLTAGDKGEKSYPSDRLIGEIRVEEAREVANILHVSHLIHEDFGDGTLPKKKTELTRYLEELIVKVNPDLGVTQSIKDDVAAGTYG